jgi:GntR family transcriptional repressor for pyruvate dehydrogenase complex
MENISKGKLSSHIALDLYLSIRSGQFIVNSWLPAENRLAIKYSVSRNTIRHAIFILRDAGLLETSHGSGTRVIASLGNFPTGTLGGEIVNKKQMLLDIYDFRRAIEIEIVAKAAIRRKQSDLEKLALNLIVAEDRISRGLDFADCCFDFHRGVAAAAYNDIGMGILVNLKAVVLQMMGCLAHVSNAGEITLQLHQNIYEAIKISDPDRALKAMSDDMDKAREQLIWALDHDPTLFLIET